MLKTTWFQLNPWYQKILAPLRLRNEETRPALSDSSARKNAAWMTVLR